MVLQIGFDDGMAWWLVEQDADWCSEIRGRVGAWRDYELVTAKMSDFDRKCQEEKMVGNFLMVEMSLESKLWSQKIGLFQRNVLKSII